MTLRELAERVVSDPLYSDSLLARARAGQLSEDIELLLLEAADGRMAPALRADIARPPAQSRTFALIRTSSEEVEHE